MSDQENQKSLLEHALSKIVKVINDGETILNQIPELIKKTQKDKIDPEMLAAAEVNQRFLKRRYRVKEAADMAGISPPTLYAAEEEGKLPAPDYRQDTAQKVRAGYTINQINLIREVFGTAPRRPQTLPAAIIGVLNLKGGSQKTTICHLFSQHLAISGSRVLLLDTDPQGSLSFYFGKRPDIDVGYEHTIAPFLLEDDEALVEAGHPEGASENLEYAIQKTYWDNIDIIPSSLQNLNIDLLMPRLMAESPGSNYDRIMKLRTGLLEVGKNYDFIIIDGTPSLNISTLNVVSACDICFVPTPAAMLDYASTIQFTGLIAETIETYLEAGIFPNIPDLRFFITKYSRSSYAKFMAKVIRKVFTVEHGDVLTNEAHHSDEIGKSSNKISSIYEINPSEADNRKKLKDTIQMFDRLFMEMHDAIWETCYEGGDRISPMDKFDEIMAGDNEFRQELEKHDEEIGEV